MAMKTCRECGQPVSSEAKVCPGCGVKKPYQSPVRGFIFIVIVAFAIFKACSDRSSSSYHSNEASGSSASTGSQSTSSDVVSLSEAAPVNLAPASTTPFSASQVCKASIAGMFGREVNTIKATKAKTAGVFTISYRRPSDGKRFSYDCKLSDDNVIWRESGQNSGRWDGSGDVEFNVEFSVQNDALTVTELYADSENIVHRFTMKDFN